MSFPRFFGTVAVALFAACRPDAAPDFGLADVRELPNHFPAFVEPEDNPLNEAKWELGRHLFFDTRLSLDGSVSCASCHNPSRAFSDTVATSLGSEGALGIRNAPALVNLAWQPRFHREAGVPSLEAQVLAPVQEPLEFNRGLNDLVDQLRLDPHYEAWAQEGFGRSFDAYVLTRALATFERTLVGGDSPYDRWLLGDNAALNSSALRGMNLFDDLECSSCHEGVLTSDFLTHNNGLYLDYEDPGAFRLTFDSADYGAFKTPSLRNLAWTAPYMFDGSMSSLEEVVEHYVTGGSGHPNQDPRVRERNVTEQDRADLVAFLDALNDSSFVAWAATLQP